MEKHFFFKKKPKKWRELENDYLIKLLECGVGILNAAEFHNSKLPGSYSTAGGLTANL